MNLMGMGIPELGVIFLVAFLVLGPGRSIDMARGAGKILGDLRRQFNEVTNAVTIEAMEERTHGQNRDAAEQGPTGQDNREAPPLDPPPGVPMRAETPTGDEEPAADTGPGSTNSGSPNTDSSSSGFTEAGPEDKG